MELRKWLEPLPLNKFLPPNATEQQKREMQNRAEVPVEVLRGTLHCIQVLSPYISKDDVKGSAIGKSSCQNGPPFVGALNHSARGASG